MTDATIHDALRAFVDRGELGGAVALVARPGKPIQRVAVGWRDVTARLPISSDTIFRIASLTKPVTAVAALRLFDEGRFELDDPITRVAPEFADLRVLPDPDAALDRAVPAGRPITFRDLLTHRAGFTYGEFHTGPIAAAYASVLGPTIENALSPDEWMARLATLPLVDEPGAHFHYGCRVTCWASCWRGWTARHSPRCCVVECSSHSRCTTRASRCRRPRASAGRR